MFLTFETFSRALSPVFFLEREKKGLIKFFGFLDQIISIKFIFTGFKEMFLILNRKFNCFSLCNFGSKPIVIFFFNTSLGNYCGFVIILKFFPDWIRPCIVYLPSTKR